jgi:cytochrome P450
VRREDSDVRPDGGTTLARSRQAPMDRCDEDLGDIRSDPLGFLERGIAAHGDIFEYRAEDWTGVVLNRPDAIKHVLHAPDGRYSKLGTPDLMMLEPMLGRGLMTSEGHQWLRQRRMAQPVFRRDNIERAIPVVTKITRQLVARWELHADRRPVSTVDVEGEFSRLTMQVIAQVLFGIDLSDDCGDIGAAIVVMNDFMAYYEGADSRLQQRYDEASLVVERIAQRILLERQLLGGGNGDLLERMLAASVADLTPTTYGDAERREPMPALREQIFTYLMAGHETTAKSLTWAVYLLGEHPEWIDRIREDTAHFSLDQPMNVASVEALVTPWLVLQEAMRLYPPVWLMTRRCVAGDEILGHSIPRGALAVISPYCMHRHPDHWERPLEFDPSRHRSASHAPYTYFPFSGGPRMCIGRPLAMVEAIVVLTALARRFRWRRVGEGEVRPEALVTLRPQGGLTIIVEVVP